MADDEQFSLCWNNFNSNLSAGFHESLQRGDLVDVTLAAEGQLVQAHRLVLSVCSPYFRKMFNQMPKNQHAFVFLKDVTHAALQDLIQFMYCGEVNVKQDALPAFISTAEALQIKGLTETGDSAPPQQSPAKEEVSAVPATTASISTTVPAASQRIKSQRNRVQSYKIESEESGDDKIVHIQASTSHHVSAQQLQAQTNISSQKRTMSQRGVTSHAMKRPKISISASSDGMDTSDNTHTPAQAQTVQTVQIVKQIPAQVIEPEYIELPMESINPKAEPDYTDETAEIETVDAETEQEHKLSEHDQGDGDDDGHYVEDETYGDMAMGKYEESYLTEGEDGAKPGASGFVDSYTSDGGTGTEQSTQEESENKNRKADHRSNKFELEFEIPDSMKPGVSSIRSYQPVKKLSNTDEIHRFLAHTFTSSKQKTHLRLDNFSSAETVPTKRSTRNNDASSRNSSLWCQSPTTTGSSRETTKQAKHALNFSEITNGTPVQMSLLPTRKGAAGVLCRGHHFEFRYSRHNHKVYRCAWHLSHLCQAQVLLYNKLFYIVHDEHTHSESSKMRADILGKITLK
ncbi:modifier of mdg4-like isoform X3 [Anopheles funestus]|uniref:modifier of mdg4-like isoform X3 n=1 Tax=Anopheles funestus TaxID=62324 RepID=UPI0020C5CC92|nr:modifier of mdg4-like isoform X3 [Anopheles funestus]